MEDWMDAKYDDEVHFDHLIENGIVFSWLRVSGAGDVRVQASRRFVEDVWKMDWNERRAVEAEYRMRRDGYKDAAMKCAGRGDEFRVYPIG
jgi:hypothetical protein